MKPLLLCLFLTGCVTPDLPLCARYRLVLLEIEEEPYIAIAAAELKAVLTEYGRRERGECRVGGDL